MSSLLTCCKLHVNAAAAAAADDDDDDDDDVGMMLLFKGEITFYSV